jgi:DNA repair protein RadC
LLYLDSDQRLIQVGEYRDGGTSPRTILSEALRLGAVGIIIGRNHPTGDSAPSETDVEAARELADMGRSLGIRLFDQLIFAGDETRSFRALGLL